jgi:hypothetical protein
VDELTDTHACVGTEVVNVAFTFGRTVVADIKRTKTIEIARLRKIFVFILNPSNFYFFY